MVAQHLTPELTQPNVLVEIDPGPPMGLHHDIRGPAPGSSQAQTPQSSSPDKEVPVSPLPCGAAEQELELTTDNACPPAFLGHGAIASVGTESVTKIEATDDGSVEPPGEYATTWLPETSRGSIRSPEEAPEDAGIIRDDLTVARERTLIEFLQQNWIEAGRQLSDTMSRSVRDSAMGQAMPSSVSTFPKSGLDQIGVVSVDCDLRLQSFRRAGNIEAVAVRNETWTTGSDKVFFQAVKPNNPLDYNFLMRDLCTGRFKKHHGKGSGDIEPPLHMSGVNGSQTKFNAYTEQFWSEIFRWMMQHSLMMSPHGRRSLPRLSHQSTELLLDLEATAVSCLYTLLPSPVERAARDKQWTEEVHCLLDDPG